jgi:hypothetical protein
VFPIVGGWYLVNIETIFFFCLGGMLSRYSLFDSIVESGFRFKLLIFFIWFALIFLRIYIDPDLNVWYVRNYTIESVLLYKIAILIGLVFLIQVSSLFAKNKTLIYLSSLTFFAYLFHDIPLSHFKIITERVVTEQFSFYVNFPIALVLVFSIAYFVSKHLPFLYAFLTGGRDTNKALSRT